MEIKLLLSKEEILQRVKARTKIKGMADMATNDSAGSVRYAHNEEAGDDPDSQFLLLSSLRTALGRFKSLVVEYVVAYDDGTPAADNIHDSLTDSTVDVFNITMEVSERFNQAYTQPLADHASAYIEYQMLCEWYLPFAPEIAKNFAAAAAAVQTEVARCFVKTRPKVPVYKYPSEIVMCYPIIPDRGGVPGYITPDSGAVEPETLFSNPWLVGIGQQSEISYTLTSETDDFRPLDDIIVRADNPSVCSIGLSGGRWCCRGKGEGYTVVTLYSRHDDSVFVKFAVRVVK